MERKNRIPNPLKIIRPYEQPFYLNPQGFSLAQARKLHDWSGRLVAHLEIWKERNTTTANDYSRTTRG